MIKKMFYVVCATLLCSGAFAQDQTISGDDIPAEIYDFVNQNFPDSKIVRVEHDRDLLESTYEVALDDRTEIVFSADKKAIEVDSESQLPKELIPVEIQNFVNDNYPESKIRGWELEDKNQVVELDNGMDLIFDENDKLIKMDD